MYFKASIFIIAYLNCLIYCAAEQDCSRSSCLTGGNTFIVQGNHMLSSFKSSMLIRREPCSSLQHLTLHKTRGEAVFSSTKYNFCFLILHQFGLGSKKRYHGFHCRAIKMRTKDNAPGTCGDDFNQAVKWKRWLSLPLVLTHIARSWIIIQPEFTIS